MKNTLPDKWTHKVGFEYMASQTDARNRGRFENQVLRLITLIPFIILLHETVKIVFICPADL